MEKKTTRHEKSKENRREPLHHGENCKARKRRRLGEKNAIREACNNRGSKIEI